MSLRSMREENAQMRQNFEALRRLHEGLGRKHAAALADLQNLQVERAARESEVGGTVDGLALELEEAKRRFEEAAPHILQPPALRSMQENLRREVAQPLKTRIADLEALVREKSGAYSQIWKENQILQANVSSEVTKAQGEIGRCKAKHTAVLEEKDRTIRDLTKLAESKRDPDLRYKAAERKAAEETARKANLEEQLQGLLEAKAQEEVERAKAWAEINRQKSELQKSALEKDRGVSAAERKAQHLRNELDSAVADNERMHNQLMELQKTERQLAEELGLLRQQTAAERQAVDEASRDERTSWSGQKAALERQVLNLEQKLSFAAQEREELAQSSQQERQVAVREAVGKAELQQKQLANQVAELQVQLEGTAALREQERTHGQLTLESVNKELAQVRSSAIKFEAAAQATEHIRTQYTKEVQSLQADCLSKRREIEDLHAQVRRQTAAQAESADLARKVANFEAENALLHKQLLDVRGAAGQSVEDQRAHIESLKRNWSLEKAAMTKQVQEVQSTVEAQFHSQVSRYKRKVEKYHEDVVRLERERSSSMVRLSELEAENLYLQQRLHAEYSFSEASLYPGKKAPSKSYLVPEQHAPGTPESLSGDSMA